ncbi:MAG: tetratricopeptide repeat protein [Myxococcota bacterium]|nr:tetratricopeptide repeat protein [Myxococcota bacterium]
MGYFSYYLAWIALTFLVQYPPLLVGLLAIFVLRRFVPDPVVLFRTMGRIQALRRQIDANPANVTARRDLAMVYVERLRPGRALELLDEARKRAPDDAELLYLTGLAQYKKGSAEKALDPLVRSVQIDPRVRFGEAYLVAGDALRKLGRSDEAIDAYERYVETNTSSIEGHVKLALAYRAAKDESASKKALAEAFSTWAQIPGYKRRKELAWWLYAWACRFVI